jgi:hypothetical protein
MAIDKKLEAALPETPVKHGLTSVPDDDLRAAITALRRSKETTKRWKW